MDEEKVMEDYLKQYNMEMRHSGSLAHIFEPDKPNYPICGRIFPFSTEVKEGEDVAVCKKCLVTLKKLAGLDDSWKRKEKAK